MTLLEFIKLKIIGPLVTNLICMSWFRDLFEDLSDVASFQLSRAENIRIPVQDCNNKALNNNTEIACWFMKPATPISNTVAKGQDNNKADIPSESIEDRSDYLVSSNEKVILYCHGNSRSRSAEHRREWYKVWQSYGYYILAIDYRGYGDSSSVSQISESSLVQDAESAYNWLLKNIHPDAKVIVWGHSLGTGVACKLGSTLSVNERRPVGYILEAPFNTMNSVISFIRENGTGLFGWTMGTIVKIFNYFFNTEEMLRNRDLKFDNEKCLLDIKETVIILHAQDDAVVPFQLGKKLYLNSFTTSEDMQFFAFEAEHKLGHDNIYRCNNLSHVMKCVSSMT